MHATTAANACRARVRARLPCVPGEAALAFLSEQNNVLRPEKVRKIMAWTTPTLVEICIGLEINGYLPAEF